MSSENLSSEACAVNSASRQKSKNLGTSDNSGCAVVAASENDGVPSGVAFSDAGAIARNIQTPPSYRGVKVTLCIDYVTVSWPKVKKEIWKKVLEGVHVLGVDKTRDLTMRDYQCNPVAGYGVVGCRDAVDREGKLLHETVDGLLQISGEGMRHLQENGMGGIELLKLLDQLGGKRTRLDGAIDVIGEGFSVNGCAKRLLQGRRVGYQSACRCPLQPFGEDSKKRSGSRGFVSILEDGSIDWETLYLGGKGSERMLRIYDKTVEQRRKVKTQKQYDEVPENWTRIELQFRDESADRAGQAMVSGGLEAIRQLVGAYVDFLDLPHWKEIISAPLEMHRSPKSISTPEQKDSWVNSKMSGIPKIVKQVIEAGRGAVFLQAVKNVVLTDEERELWRVAFGSGG